MWILCGYSSPLNTHIYNVSIILNIIINRNGRDYVIT